MSSNGSQSSMSDNINLTSLSPEPNPSNSFYASFKIYINKFSGSSGSEKYNSNSGKTSPKKSDTNASKTKSKHSCGSSGGSSCSPTKIVRIEQIECDENSEFVESGKSEFVDSGFVKTCDETDDDVFVDANSCTDGQQDDFQIKVHPPSADISRGPTPETEMDRKSQRENRENSPVFYLEPDDWSDEVMPRPGVLTSPTRALSPCGPSVLTSPTRALSPCGCGKTHCNNSHMESLPEELVSSASTVSAVGKNNSSMPSPNSQKSASGSVLTLPCCSPRAAMMSELAAQQPPTRQRKVTIPILHSRAANNASMVRSKFRN